jgi:ProP effector
MGRHCAGPAAATIAILVDATAAMPETLPPADDTTAAPVDEPAAPPAAPAIPELSPAACGARLADLFPALFAQRPQPLKLRIQADIQQRAPGIFTRKTLSAFLHRHTTTNAYLVSLTQAPQRVDLDGAPAGDISEEHRQAAVQELARRRGLHEERRAAENAARRAVEAQAREAHAAQDHARRDRAALLRAFEASNITKANFCALKGLTEADLDAQLQLARTEAQQRAQEPRPEPRHDAGAPRRDGPRPPDHRDARRGPRTDAGPRPGPGPGPRSDAPRGPRPARDAGRGEPRR